MSIVEEIAKFAAGLKRQGGHHKFELGLETSDFFRVAGECEYKKFVGDWFILNVCACEVKVVNREDL